MQGKSCRSWSDGEAPCNELQPSCSDALIAARKHDVSKREAAAQELRLVFENHVWEFNVEYVDRDASLKHDSCWNGPRTITALQGRKPGLHCKVFAT